MAEEDKGEVGAFWIVGQENRTVTGQLQEVGRLRLVLDNSLTSMYEEAESHFDNDGNLVSVSRNLRVDEIGPFDVFGLLSNGEKVSLFDCATVNRQMSVFDFVDGQQTIEPIFGLRGGHLDKTSAFTSIHIELRHLDRWADGVDTEEADMRDGSAVKLLAKSARNGRAAIEIVSTTSRTIREIERSFEVPLASLATLCTLKPTPAIRVWVSQQGDAWHEIVSEHFSRVAAETYKPLRRADNFVPLADLGAKGVAAWLDSVERLGPIPAVVASSVGSSSMALEATLLQLTTVAEGLHRRLGGETPDRVSESTYRRLKAIIKKALQDEDVELRRDVMQNFGYIRSAHYIDRLVVLMKWSSGVVVEALSPDPGAWSTTVKSMRNEFAHGENVFITPEGSAGYAAIAYSLRWLLLAVLLLQTRISAAVLRSRLLATQEYRFFVRQAPGLFPSLYERTGQP